MKISVTITPNAREASVAKNSSGGYSVKVISPSREGRANKELIDLLSQHLDVSKSNIEIIRGLKSRNKIVNIND